MSKLLWLAAVSSVCLMVSVSAGEPAGSLPTVRSAEELLAEQIGRVIKAGHLRPVVANPSEQYWQVMRHLRGANMIEYWHNPAETIYTLLRALPHVPKAMRGPLKEYIQREWKEYPPYEYTSTGWKGAPREIFPIPPEKIQEKLLFLI